MVWQRGMGSNHLTSGQSRISKPLDYPAKYKWKNKINGYRKFVKRLFWLWCLYHLATGVYKMGIILLCIIQVLLCTMFLPVIFGLENQIINIHSHPSFSKNKWRRAQHSKLIPFSTHRLAGEPQTFWVYSAYNGADGETRTHSLRFTRALRYHCATSAYLVGILRLELTSGDYKSPALTYWAISP